MPGFRLPPQRWHAKDEAGPFPSRSLDPAPPCSQGQSPGPERRCPPYPACTPLQRMFLRATKSVPTLLSVYVTCVYMALKVSDRVKHTGMLSAMLTDMLGRRVHSWQAVQLEVECLVGLTWRLGPYFSTTTARI
ncbi:hypothetical protein ACKKBF_B33950 [Auxenochlorella protothecoides x Auxenochlorella symbiontica]